MTTLAMCGSVTGTHERCPGGVPGTCAEKPIEHEPRVRRVRGGHSCKPRMGNVVSVGAGQLGLFVLVMLSLPVGLCVVYYLIATENRAKQKDSIALIAIMASQVVTSMQVLGVFDLLLVTLARALRVGFVVRQPPQLQRGCAESELCGVHHSAFDLWYDNVWLRALVGWPDPDSLCGRGPLLRRKVF